MAKRGKKYRKMREEKPMKPLPLTEALDTTKKLSYSSFPGSIELHLVIKIPKEKDPKSIKGAVSFPHVDKIADINVAVFTTKEKEPEAKKAGADLYDLEKLMKDVQAGKIEFDIAIASPEVMGQIASLGKELGPRGLMPNPKTGTVTDEIGNVVQEYKKGKTPFRADDSGNMHFKVGNVEMENEKLVENISVALVAAGEAIGKKPEQIVKRAYLTPTMGPSVELLLDFDTM